MGDFAPPDPKYHGWTITFIFWAIIAFCVVLEVITWPFRRLFGWFK